MEQAIAARKNLRRAATAYLAVIFLIGTFLWGYWLGNRHASNPAVGTTASGSTTVEIMNAGENKSVEKLDFNEFWDLWQTIKDRYVKQPVDEKKLFYGAMAGVVGSLGDPHSVFFDPATNKEFTQELAGKLDGIGAEIGVKKNALVIVAPLPGSPAEKAGLKAGDRIVAVDGVDTTGMALDDAVNRIRGDKGTKVKLLILRDGWDKPRIFEIVRETISIPSVKLDMIVSPKGKKLAVIEISHFNGDTAARFLDAVGQLQGKQVDGLILDLRNNPGGYLDAAVSILGEWLPGEVVVSERYADKSVDSHTATGLGRLKDIKTVLLVNGGSASASEITAGALQDDGKGILIGTQTFGKGSVQDLIPFKDGSSVKLTIAEWLTPKGKNINENGITPDYRIELTDDDFANGRDPQMAAAKGYFDGVTPTQSASATPVTK